MNWYMLNILVEDREGSYIKVNEFLHEFSNEIKLRVGYPVPEENFAVIFLILRTDNDTAGALSGKLGQIKGVKAKLTLVKRG